MQELLKPKPPREFTATQLRDVAHRELSYRRRVYLHMVNDGHMTREKASYEIAAMEAILAHFEALAERERLL